MFTNSDETLWLDQVEASALLSKLSDSSVKLIIADPPWGTGGIRKAVNGEYSDKLSAKELEPTFRAFLDGAKRVLSEDGTLAVWLDYRAGPYFAVWGDQYLDRVGEVIIHQELGNPGKASWPIKHSTVYLFAKDSKRQYFNIEALPLEARKAPKAGYEGEKRINSVVRASFSNTDPERVHYPDQKPSWVYRLFVDAYTLKGDLVVDPFAGSGSLGSAVAGSGRIGLMGDINPLSVAVIRSRFKLVEETEG